MDFDVPSAAGGFRGTFRVPASKSMLQRALVLQSLADVPGHIDMGAVDPPGDDPALLGAALEALGTWTDGAVGTSRESRRVDLGYGATGYRLILPVAALRPAGARTLVTGRPALRARPHRPLVRVLGRCGVSIKRRQSGSLRVLGGGYRSGAVTLDPRTSSQFATALMLAAPRTGGIELRFTAPCVMRPYLRITAAMLATFGIEAELSGLDTARGRVRVAAGAPRAATIAMEPDASAAAALWAAAALTGSSITVAGTRTDSAQADTALLPLLEQMGAGVVQRPEGVEVTGPGGRLRAPGEVDLQDATDLLPLLSALAAGAEGETHIHGVAHTRGKESDRIAASAAAIQALGGTAAPEGAGALRIRGARLRGGHVDVARDHRIAFAFGALGLAVPGVTLRGAEAVSKSHPAFLTCLTEIAAAASTAGT